MFSCNMHFVNSLLHSPRPLKGIPIMRDENQRDAGVLYKPNTLFHGASLYLSLSTPSLLHLFVYTPSSSLFHCLLCLHLHILINFLSLHLLLAPPLSPHPAPLASSYSVYTPVLPPHLDPSLSTCSSTFFVSFSSFTCLVVLLYLVPSPHTNLKHFLLTPSTSPHSPLCHHPPHATLWIELMSKMKRFRPHCYLSHKWLRRSWEDKDTQRSWSHRCRFLHSGMDWTGSHQCLEGEREEGGGSQVKYKHIHNTLTALSDRLLFKLPATARYWTNPRAIKLLERLEVFLKKVIIKANWLNFISERFGMHWSTWC